MMPNGYGQALLDIRLCGCRLECRECSRSGWQWHTHAPARCPLHPEAPVS